MKYPPTTPLSHRLMTSKTRFLCDGAGGVWIKCYFSRLSLLFHAFFAALKPSPGVTDHALRPSIDPSRRYKYRHTTTVQLLTKKRSIVLSLRTEIIRLAQRWYKALHRGRALLTSRCSTVGMVFHFLSYAGLFGGTTGELLG